MPPALQLCIIAPRFLQELEQELAALDEDLELLQQIKAQL